MKKTIFSVLMLGGLLPATFVPITKSKTQGFTTNTNYFKKNHLFQLNLNSIEGLKTY